MVKEDFLGCKLALTDRAYVELAILLLLWCYLRGHPFNHGHWLLDDFLLLFPLFDRLLRLLPYLSFSQLDFLFSNLLLRLFDLFIGRQIRLVRALRFLRVFLPDTRNNRSLWRESSWQLQLVQQGSGRRLRLAANNDSLLRELFGLIRGLNFRLHHLLSYNPLLDLYRRNCKSGDVDRLCWSRSHERVIWNKPIFATFFTGIASNGLQTWMLCCCVSIG